MSAEWFIVGGTLVLASVALLQDHIRSWIATPKLKISTQTAAPFCKKLLFRHATDPEIKSDGYALRIAVKNSTPCLRAKSRAVAVEVFASKLMRKEQDGQFHPVQGFEPTNLIWSHSFEPFADISPDMERYCFIGRALRPQDRKSFPDFDKEDLPPDEVCLRIDTHIARHTKEHIIPPGTYQIECLIGASNTKAVEKNLEIRISGEWFENEVDMFDKGLSIEII